MSETVNKVWKGQILLGSQQGKGILFESGEFEAYEYLASYCTQEFGEQWYGHQGAFYTDDGRMIAYAGESLH